MNPQPAALALAALGGRATRAELLARTGRHQVAQALAEGRVVAAARGIYVLPDLPPARLAAARARGLVSHLSAAQLWQWPLPDQLDRHHVTVAPGSHPPEQPHVVHHRLHVASHERHLDRTSALRTVLDCSASEAFPLALAVAESALRQPAATLDELREAADRWAHRCPQRVRRVALWAAAKADNLFESLLRGTLLDAGLTSFLPQYPVPLGHYVAHVDLADPHRRIAIEAEGFGSHGDRGAFERDIERYDELVRRGWLVLRFTWRQLRHRPDWVVFTVGQAVDSRPAVW